MSGREPNPRALRLVMTVIWGAQLGGTVFMYFFLRSPPAAVPESAPVSVVDFVGLMSLAASMVVRWLVLPRQSELRKAFTVFIIGAALAENCAVLAIFINVVWADELFALGVLGLVQYAPFLMPRLFQPASSPFTTGR